MSVVWLFRSELCVVLAKCQRGPPVCRHRNRLQSPRPPPQPSSLLEMCLEEEDVPPLSVAEMIAALSGSDLFMLRIKLIGLHIAVRVRCFRMEMGEGG